MFSVYEYDRELFSGPLEGMYKVLESSTKRNAPSYPDAEERVEKITDNRTKGRHFADLITKEARTAYREVINFKNELEPVIHAYQVMKYPVMTLDTTMTIQEALAILRKKHIAQMPLLNPQIALEGMITETILLEYLYDRHFEEKGSQTTLREIAERKVISAHPITDLRRIAKVLTDFGLNAVTIISKNKELVGIVTRHDIIERLAHEPPLHIWA